MKKVFEIQAQLDDREFNRTADSMRNKLKDLYAPADLLRMQTQTSGRLQSAGMGGILGQPPEALQKSGMAAKRELDSYIREQAQGQEKLTRLIVQREGVLEKLKKKQQEMVAGSKQELDIKKQIAQVEENNYRMAEQYRQRDKLLNQALNMRGGGPGDPGASDPARGPLASMGSSKVKTDALTGAAIGSIIAAAGRVMGIGSEMYGNYANAPLRTAGNLGRGVQSTIGADSQTIYGRRSAFEAAFNPERTRAAQMALEASQGNRAMAGGGLAGKLLMGAGAGASAGAAATALGGPLTALGGGVLGGIGGAAIGAYKAFGDPAQRALMMSAIPGSIGKRYGAEYESIQTAKTGEDYQKALADLKNQNPGKTMASQYYEQNYQGNLQSQRAMGMSNEGFYGRGGFLQGGVNAGFGPEMMQQMSSGILGAGGSSRGAAGNSVFGNQLARNMNMTNSPQILGALSGGMGGAEASREATIKILSEGMRLGLDDSKFAEENRRFTQVAAEIISRSGAQSEGDAGRTAGGFGGFVAENTNKGIEAAKSAYEQYQQISSTTSGPRGVMRAAGFLSDPKLSMLSTIEKQSLMGMKEEEINEGNLQAVAIADKLGISVDDLKDRVGGKNKNAVSRFSAHDQARDRLKQKGINIGDIKSSKDFATLDEQSKKDILAMSTAEGAENAFANPREARSFMSGQLGQKVPTDIQEDRDRVARAKATGPGGRQEDLTNADAAKDFGIVLNNFRDFKKDIIPTAEAIEKFTGKIREMMIALNAAATDIDKSNIIKYYTKSRAETQGQSGKKSQ